MVTNDGEREWPSPACCEDWPYCVKEDHARFMGEVTGLQQEINTLERDNQKLREALRVHAISGECIQELVNRLEGKFLPAAERRETILQIRHTAAALKEG